MVCNRIQEEQQRISGYLLLETLSPDRVLSKDERRIRKLLSRMVGESYVKGEQMSLRNVAIESNERGVSVRTQSAMQEVFFIIACLFL